MTTLTRPSGAYYALLWRENRLLAFKCRSPRAKTVTRKGELLYFLVAFDQHTQQAVEESIPRLIPVEEAEVKRFACNIVVIRRNVVLNSGCNQLANVLMSRSCKVHQTDLGEFIKS